MGLAVAYQLARDGHVPVLFEADDRVGGMTATFDFDGLDIERYYHFHCISDHAFLQMLDELNLGSKMQWVETKMGYWYQNRLQPWGNPGAAAFKGAGPGGQIPLRPACLSVDQAGRLEAAGPCRGDWLDSPLGR
jgi:protoporphyrinogen oxidase